MPDQTVDLVSAVCLPERGDGQPPCAWIVLGVAGHDLLTPQSLKNRVVRYN
jgi:hypothetical protein